MAGVGNDSPDVVGMIPTVVGSNHAHTPVRGASGLAVQAPQTGTLIGSIPSKL
jgi:hypothetical protein